ncbi:hypothetical protein [Streptobacillus moniliformis]|uniref:hypothetical protein n=1 Tax=Streptobacillus moniliformis TaxID=34105 RepID=UPI0001A388B8|nr:hypothetical protein [Streptobacillus moniliformis]AVL42424.1 hypothetical protein CEP89_00420 [Streptobacillus moniliformis]QXW65964.1 hypothetical protein KX935_01570 [Streptobacillus moniliformis]SQA13629.1 Major membrane immunogen, membrane-anchored lipoprotein [Streptobacillus moniliformis]
MKRFWLMLLMVIGITTFSNYNDGKYEASYKKNDYTLTIRVIIKNSRILSVDFDKIDEKGVKLSTKNSEFREKKDIVKKYIVENQSFENLPDIYDKSSNKEFQALIEYLIEKCKSSKPGYFEMKN